MLVEKGPILLEHRPDRHPLFSGETDTTAYAGDLHVLGQGRDALSLDDPFPRFTKERRRQSRFCRCESHGPVPEVTGPLSIIDFIPVPELDNLEKFTSILENLPEEDAKAIMYNVPLDTLDELVKLAEDKRPDISTKLLRLMRKYRKSKWIPNPEVC